jgi:hypothetical protein
LAVTGNQGSATILSLRDADNEAESTAAALKIFEVDVERARESSTPYPPSSARADRIHRVAQWALLNRPSAIGDPDRQRSDR